MTSLNVKVIHHLPGRVRLLVPGLKGNKPAAKGINETLSQVNGIYKVQANPLTGRVLIYFNENNISLATVKQKTIEVNTQVKQAVSTTVETKRHCQQIEPEDLPIKRQLLNVALGGSVLAYMGIKHLFVGRTPLAKHPHIFNLTAATAIVSGYPLIKSGFQSLASGRLNHDAVISGLALGTVLARESIPGLMVIWLANLTALGQSLVLRGYQKTIAKPEGHFLNNNSNLKELPAVTWQQGGQEYSQKALLPVAGVSALYGLIGGKNGFQKAMAMLLAASPSPAGLAAPTAATATMVRASKKKIVFRDTHAVEKAAAVDTLIINGTDAFLPNKYVIKDVLPLEGLSINKLLSSALQAENDHSYIKILSNTLKERQKHLYVEQNLYEKKASVLVGDKETMTAAGIDTQPAIFKAKRLQHLGQLPVYVAINNTLVGIIGIKQQGTKGVAKLIHHLKIAGIKQIYILADQDPLGISEIWSDLSNAGLNQLLGKVKQNSNVIAVVNGNDSLHTLVEQADLNIMITDQVNNGLADIIIPNQTLLPEAFMLAAKGKLRTKQNLALVKTANALGLTLAASGRLNPMAANVFNNLISVAVGANSYRLLTKRFADRGTQIPLQTANQEIAAALGDNLATDLSFTNANSSSYQYCGTWHNLTIEQTLQKLQVSLQQGLNPQDITERLTTFGPNKLAEPKPKSFWARVKEQFKDFLVKALVGSAAVCAFMGQFGDALAIVVILIMNALLGAMQEQKADGSLQALSKMTAPTATVRRAGKVVRIPAADLLPGDIVLLEQGDSVPADLRLLETHLLEIEESALTGEPYPVLKSSNPISECVPLLDCQNLAFMGTNVTKGRAVGIVISTGMSTEIGKIAGMLNEQEEAPTPLQNRMAEVGNTILKYCLAVSGLVVLAGVLRGGSLFQMLLTGVSLAVAAIPEGLPAVVTIAMASGVRRMAKEHAVVRQLPAVETLGNATLICTDKTGTLTQNRQHVQSVFTAGGWWHTTKQKQLQAVNESNRSDLVDLLTAATLCNDATLKSKKAKWQVSGDPTEGALLMVAANEGLDYQQLRNSWQRTKEIPFDSERLRMTVICHDEVNGAMSFVKGAPEVIIERCQQARLNGETVSLSADLKKQIITANKEMTKQAMRVLAIACRQVNTEDDKDTAEKDLTFLGLVGMVDPPRAEVKSAITKCHRAGIKVVMITGDHPHTALAIAKEVGITKKDRVLTGQQLDNMTDYELAAAVLDVDVFARVLPTHKLRLIKAFKQRGQILAMVGDGINDAPAVKESDIGVAMGESGTDVTKQASAIVLTDDNFATLVSAVEQGRGIYNNIKRSVRYLLSTNVGLVSLVFLSVVFGLPMPLLPIQLLFINVLGDGLPALALGVEKPSKELMQQPPRAKEENFFADGLDSAIISKGLAIGVVGLAAYYRALKQGTPEHAQTMAMATFTVSKLLTAMECSDQKNGKSFNRYLIGSVALSFALLLGAIYLPSGRRIFKTSPLSSMNVASVFATAGITWVTEKLIAKILKKAANNRQLSSSFIGYRYPF